MGRAKAKIPDRWESYSSLGKRISDTRFICCKCPLKEELCRKLPSKSQWFTPSCLFRLMTENGQALGLVIDLTNTDRYYSPDSFTFAGVEYAKIFTPGHDVPGADAIVMFREVIEAYERKYANKELLIVVHCTHGVNRTGYQICHYLIETCGWSFEKAVQAFNVARGHPIERENYLEALKLLENKINKNRFGIKGGEEFKSRHIRFSSTSSSSDSETADQQQPVEDVTSGVATSNAAYVSGTPAMAHVSAGPATAQPPLPNVFPAPLVQQMLMGVAQMQALFSHFSQQQRATASPTTYAPSNNPSVVNDDQPTSSNLVSEEGNDDKEEAEGSSSSSTTAEEGNEEISGSASGTPNPDWELGGKVQRRIKTSAQKRRERQKRLREMHRKMQSGKFWEIREMQKEKYGF